MWRMRNGMEVNKNVGIVSKMQLIWNCFDGEDDQEVWLYSHCCKVKVMYANGKYFGQPEGGGEK